VPQRKIEELIARSEMNGLIENHMEEVNRLVAGRGGTVRWNPHLRPGCPVYDRFIEAASGMPTPLRPDTTRIAYHGTGPDNIESILQHGMDPSKRTESGRGFYDWYGTHIDQWHVREKGGNTNIVVFALLMDPRLLGGGFQACPHFTCGDVLTGTKSDHALPLGAISLAA
jgi:hypothetical protein